MVSPDPTNKPSRGLLRNPDFLKLWIGQSISELGSRVTRDGIPLLAVINLGATPFDMGLLNTAAGVPVLLIGLFAGVWVDRLRRRPLMIAADLGRALLLFSIPLAAFNGWLNITQLYIVIAFTGILTVLFNTAYRSYLPVLIQRENIVEGNAKLALSDSIAEIAGPGIAGLLVQLITAPFAILADALSFLASVLSLALIRKPEPVPAPPEERQGAIFEAAEGLRAVFRNPMLRALTAAAATGSFFGNFIGVLYALYAVRELKLSPAVLGIVIAMGGAGNLVGAYLAERVPRRLGVGRTLVASLAAGWLATLLIPLSGVIPGLAVPFLIIGQLSDMVHTIYFVNAISLRQSITADRMLGRINASMELLAEGIGPLGALTGGLLGSLVGVQPTLFLAVIGGSLSVLWLVFSPLRHLREIPAAENPANFPTDRG